MSKLNILWTNDNVTTAKLMVFMYAINGKKRQWFDEFTIIIWGATAKLVAENKEIQALIETAKENGVHVSACEACAKELGVYDTLLDLGIELKYWGEPLTNIIKNDEKLITI